jgi:hypothetical protein
MNALAGLPVEDRVFSANLPQGQLEVLVERSEMPAQDLFCLGTRNNPKRAFLFLSHVLGKHLPVAPMVMEDIHERLARHIPDLPQPVIFIGMAETATCLGQGVFEAWRRAHPDRDGLYLHTTRYEMADGTPVEFEETHSHAPLQWFYLPTNSALRDQFQNARSLVLIDDEISTGSTFVNLARACQVVAKNIGHIHLAAITDFTGSTHREQLASSFGATLTVGSLLSGQWRFQPNGRNAPAPSEAQAPSGMAPTLIDHGFGRLGRSTCLSLPRDRIKTLGATILPSERVLVLGTGEFMHPAFVLARELHNAIGATVHMHATTRSPILVWGPITHALSFTDNYGEEITNYLYNCGAVHYDHVFLCHETGPTPSLIEIARQLGARLLHFRSEIEIEENSFR